LDIFTGKGGANIATMLETLKNTPAGQELFEKFMAKKETKNTETPEKSVDAEVVEEEKKGTKKKVVKK
jgi:hypothetical protein